MVSVGTHIYCWKSYCQAHALLAAVGWDQWKKPPPTQTAQFPISRLKFSSNWWIRVKHLQLPEGRSKPPWSSKSTDTFLRTQLYWFNPLTRTMWSCTCQPITSLTEINIARSKSPAPCVSVPFYKVSIVCTLGHIQQHPQLHSLCTAWVKQETNVSGPGTALFQLHSHFKNRWGCQPG